MNRGSAYVDRSMYAQAVRDFERSSRLGDEGMGEFNIGAILAAQGKHAQALAAFDQAERHGYKLSTCPSSADSPSSRWDACAKARTSCAARS